MSFLEEESIRKWVAFSAPPFLLRVKANASFSSNKDLLVVPFFFLSRAIKREIRHSK